MDKYVIVKRIGDNAWQETKMHDGSRKLFDSATEAQLVLDTVPPAARNNYRVKVLPKPWTEIMDRGERHIWLEEG